MNINRIKEIKEKISRAEIESAKAAGIVENIQKEWQKKYGTSDIEKIKEILKEKEAELQAKNERMEKLYNDLIAAYDWESI